MYEMSFLWNNNVCCGCTGFLHILWAFIAANMREGEGHNRLLISWMQEFPTVRRGGSESQHGLCIFRIGKASNFYQVTVKISLLVVERPVSQQEARTSQTASSLFEGAERWWEYKYLWGSCVCWPGLNFSHTLCFFGEALWRASDIQHRDHMSLHYHHSRSVAQQLGNKEDPTQQQTANLAV